MTRFLVTFLFLAIKAHGFIPPVTSILRDIFESRKSTGILELVLVHQVANSNGGWSEIEERILADPRGLKFLWKSANSSVSIAGSLEKRNYWIGTEKKIAIRSFLFLKSYLVTSAVEFRDALISEKFLRWEQLKQFKEGFEPQGDPQSWDIKSNYIAHDSISLVLLPTGPTIAVVGYQDANSKRTVYFNKNGNGIKRFEWSDPGENLSWNFDPSTVSLKEGIFSKSATLNKDGRDIIQSELLGVRSLNKRQITDWLQSWQRGSKSLVNAPVLEESLRTLLSSR